MAGAVKIDLRELEKMKDSMINIQKEIEGFIISCSKELAARLLRKVIKRTPVGQYPKGSGKVGGVLRRGWIAKSEREAELGTAFNGSESVTMKYINSIGITKNGSTYTIVVANSVSYASYVEFGHRTRNHKGWVPGRFMLTISEDELKGDVERVIQNKMRKKFGMK